MAVLSFAELTKQQREYYAKLTAFRYLFLNQHRLLGNESPFDPGWRKPEGPLSREDIDWSDYDYGEWE